MEFIPVGGLVKLLTMLFQAKPGDIPVCQTRVLRGGRGWPWDHRIGIHPRPDGKLEVTKIP